MGKHNWYQAFTAGFLVLCLVPSAGMLLAGPEEAGGNEVRAAAPALVDGAGTLNTAYLTQLSDYVGDGFYPRQKLITAWSGLNAAIGASTVEDVVLGEDGWLYFGQTLDDYTGSDLLTEREIFSAARNLSLMQEYCNDLGADFVFTVAPNKNSLYPENMPDLPMLSTGRNADALAAALADEGVRYCDLFAAFGGQGETLYFAQDSHWNSKGAALAADAITASLGRGTGYFAGPFAPVDDHVGDLYAMLYPAGGALETDQKYQGALGFTYDVPIRSAENQTILTTGSGEGSLLLFRDSFGNLLYPYLADAFGSALFSRAMPYTLTLAADRPVDCVAVELVERNLDYLVRYLPVMPAPARLPAQTADAGGSVRLTAGDDGTLEGYVRITGTLDAAHDLRSGVYLCTEELWYEAFLLEDESFGLYVPAESLGGALAVAFSADGALAAQPAVLQN